MNHVQIIGHDASVYPFNSLATIICIKLNIPCMVAASLLRNASINPILIPVSRFDTFDVLRKELRAAGAILGDPEPPVKP